MCGIAGIYGYRDGSISQDELLAIRDAMIARGPDDAGIWVNHDQSIGLAHRRLSILDLSQVGSQPMFDATGNVVVFNGEIYNYPELRQELESAGRIFRSNSDTEVLLHLYTLYGEAMLEKLRGMYAFALWDQQSGSLFLARDPFGIKPLYYASDGHFFRFASQVRALLKGKVDTRPDPAGHVGFFLWGSVPDPHTLYQGIQALPAGHSMRVTKDGGVTLPSEFSSISDMIASARPQSLEKEAALQTLSEAVDESVRAHCLADVVVGTFLSAGLDSTLIASRASVDLGQVDGLRTVTLGFDEYADSENDEVPLAEDVARLLGANHTTVRVQAADFESERERFFAAMDQPSIDGLNVWFVAKAAAEQGLKVALSGLGGDELFASYPSFTDVPRMTRLFKPFSAFPGLGEGFRLVAAPLLKRLTSPKYAGLIEYGGSMSDAYLLRRGLYMPWELPEILDPDLAREGWEALQTRVCLSHTITGLPHPRMAVSALEMSWYMRHQLLRDADWAGMAHSLEIRVPLVDSKLLQQAVPVLMKHPGLSKREVVAAIAPNLPSTLFQRPKTGFSVPLRSWLLSHSSGQERGLRGWAKQVYATVGQSA